MPKTLNELRDLCDDARSERATAGNFSVGPKEAAALAAYASELKALGIDPFKALSQVLIQERHVPHVQQFADTYGQGN